MGPDPGSAGRKNRAQRQAALGSQPGVHFSKNGLHVLIPDDPGVEDHVAAARKLKHPFDCPPDIRLDLQFTAKRCVQSRSDTRQARYQARLRLEELVAGCEPYEERIRAGMKAQARDVSATLKLAFFHCLSLLLRWPDWSMTSLFTRGFKVAGKIEASNVYPTTACPVQGYEHDLTDNAEADLWNEALSRHARRRLRPGDLRPGLRPAGSRSTQRVLHEGPA